MIFSRERRPRTSVDLVENSAIVVSGLSAAFAEGGAGTMASRMRLMLVFDVVDEHRWIQ